MNKDERRTAEVVQATADQVIRMAVQELRRADAVRAIANQVIDLMTQEIKDHRGAISSAGLQAALDGLNDAEVEIRLRGEARAQ